MSWLSEFIKGGKNPADAAMPYLNQIPDMAKGYFNPYINLGLGAGRDFASQSRSMAGDPTKFLDELMSHYEPSRSYQLKRDEALRAAGNTAAAGGMRGSLQDIEQESRLADALLGEDMQQWLNNVLGIQGRGMSGEQSIFGTGFDASKSLSSDLANVLGTEAQLAFQGQREKNQRQADLLRSLMNLGGAAFGAFNGSNWNTLPSAGGMFF